MPNWVYNTLTANDEAGRQFITDNCLDGQGKFTFNKLVPMPKILEHTVSPAKISSTPEKFEAFKQQYGENTNCSFEHIGMLYVQLPESWIHDCIMTPECSEYLLEHYHAVSWYDWSYANWGCKWDASGDSLYDSDTYGFQFCTPWGYPNAFVSTFAQKAYEACPESTFSWEWEEEQGFGALIEIAGGAVVTTSTWDQPYCDVQYNLRLDFSDGTKEDITLYHYLGGGDGHLWELFYRYRQYSAQSPLHAIARLCGKLKNSVERITPLDSIIEAICMHEDDHPFNGVEGSFSEKLRLFIMNRYTTRKLK